MPAPTKAEVAVRHLRCRTSGCAAKPTAPCVFLTGVNKGKPRGSAYGPHADRLADAAVWLAGYSVGAESREAEVSHWEAEATLWKDEHDDTQVQLRAAENRLDTATQRISNLLAQIEALTEKPFLFGAAYGGNTDPTALEQEAGVPLGLSVTYWNLDTRDNAIRRAKADHAAGRIPWLSFKFGAPWSDVAAGKVDTKLTDLATKLGALDFDVWITFHHEPEGDEPDMTKFVAAQRHALGMMPDNVRRWVTLTGWTNLYGGNSAYDPEKLWPGDDVCDGISLDPYNEFASYKHPTGDMHWTDLVPYFDYLQAFATKHGCAWAIRETGLTDQAVVSGHAGATTWITDTAAKAKERGAAGFCYFASDLNLQPGDIVGIDKSPTKRADFINAMRKFAPK